jgi:hypothetical protein
VGILGRGGDDRRWCSHGDRGGGGGELVGKEVPIGFYPAAHRVVYPRW